MATINVSSYGDGSGVDYTGTAAAIAASSNGDTVQMGTGTASWTSLLTITKAITLQGNGIGNTIIKDQIPDGNSDGLTDSALISVTLVSNLVTRITEIEFQDGTVDSTNFSGVLQVSGANTDSRQIRIDHCKFSLLQGTNLFCSDCIGVIDHCAFSTRVGDIAIYIYHQHWNGVDYSDGSFADTVTFGSANFLFIEDNTFTRPAGNHYAITDAYRGARYVVRYNSITRGWVEAHGTDSGGRYRGTRAVEVYNNSFTGDNNGNYVVNFRSGTGRVWNNTVTGYLGSAHLTVAAYRLFYTFSTFGAADGANTWDANIGGGPFLTGTATGGSATTMQDTTKSWTVNQWAGYSIKATDHVSSGQIASIIVSNTSNTITYSGDGGYATGNPDRMIYAAGYGYAIYKVDEVFDQPGRGQGTSLGGVAVPTPIANNQTDEPIYAWGNTEDGVSFGIISDHPYQIRDGEHWANADHSYTPYTYPHPLQGSSQTAGMSGLVKLSGNATIA